MGFANKPSATDEGFKFESLFGDLGLDAFLGTCWEREVYTGRGPDWLTGYLPSAEIEALIASMGTPDSNWIQVVRDGKAIAARSFTNGEGFVDLPAIHQAYLAGYTVQLSKLQIRHPRSGLLCRDAERVCLERRIDLARPIGSHLYVTPPRRRGLLPHYDDHNVFVLQLAGMKRWRLYDSGLKPLARQAGDLGADDLPPLSHELELRRGDVLYVPRGCYHEASTDDQASVHLTLDLYPLTLLQIVERAIRAAPALGAAIPSGMNPAQERETLTAAAAALAADLDLTGALSALRDEFRAMLYPLPSGGFEPLDRAADLSAATLVHHRPGAIAQSWRSEEEAVLWFAGSSSTAPAAAARLFDFIAQNPVFPVGALPDPEDDAEKIELVRDLIAAGLLEISR